MRLQERHRIRIAVVNRDIHQRLLRILRPLIDIQTYLVIALPKLSRTGGSEVLCQCVNEFLFFLLIHGLSFPYAEIIAYSCEVD